MKKYEISFFSSNTEAYPKMITALIIEPTKLNSHTGAMLFTHGWGGNRFQHQDKMEYTADKFNLICISTEYRQSGYDFDPVKGLGAYLPYDASFYQVFDVLNSLREMLHHRSAINRKRIFHYGGSQGGHIALLSSIFAPATFAFIYASSPLVYIDEKIKNWTGRAFAKYELSVRNVIEHAYLIKCPLFIDHGTADSTVSVEHSKLLENKLKELGKEHLFKYYEGGEHSLEPAINKLEAFKAIASAPISILENHKTDDFALENKIGIDCGEKILNINWSKSTESSSLFGWEAII
jgi:predicted esterase